MAGIRVEVFEEDGDDPVVRICFREVDGEEAPSLDLLFFHTTKFKAQSAQEDASSSFDFWTFHLVVAYIGYRLYEYINVNALPKVRGIRQESNNTLT